MKFIAEHFGEAAIYFVILIALGTLIVGLLTGDGYVAEQFKSALEGFFTGMNSIPGMP